MTKIRIREHTDLDGKTHWYAEYRKHWFGVWHYVDGSCNWESAFECEVKVIKNFSKYRKDHTAHTVEKLCDPIWLCEHWREVSRDPNDEDSEGMLLNQFTVSDLVKRVLIAQKGEAK